MGREAIDNFFAAMDTYSRGARALLNLVSDYKKPEEKPKNIDLQHVVPERLTAEKLRELRYMTSWQLDAIFKSGKKPVVIDDTAEAFRELRKMNSWQLSAIFGDDEEE